MIQEFIARRPTCKAVQWDGSKESTGEIVKLYGVPGLFEVVERFYDVDTSNSKRLKTPLLRDELGRGEFVYMHVGDWMLVDELGHVHIRFDEQFKRDWERNTDAPKEYKPHDRTNDGA